MDHVVQLLDDNDLDILALTEIWLRPGDANQTEINALSPITIFFRVTKGTICCTMSASSDLLCQWGNCISSTTNDGKTVESSFVAALSSFQESCCTVSMWLFYVKLTSLFDRMTPMGSCCSETVLW